MSDIFNEINEELRRDKAAELFKRHGNLIIALVVIVVAATGAWVYYERSQREQAEADGARFEAALELGKAGKAEEAEKALIALGQNGSGGYRALARLRAAAEAGKTDPAKGALAYDALASDGALVPEMQQLATLRAAMLRFDTADAATIKAALEPLAAPGNIWRNSARELLGLSALKAGDGEGAGRWFDQIVTDGSAPRTLAARVEVYLGLVRSGPVAKTQ